MKNFLVPGTQLKHIYIKYGTKKYTNQRLNLRRHYFSCLRTLSHPKGSVFLPFLATIFSGVLISCSEGKGVGKDYANKLKIPEGKMP